MKEEVGLLTDVDINTPSRKGFLQTHIKKIVVISVVLILVVTVLILGFMYSRDWKDAEGKPVTDPKLPPTVILISLDGFRHDYLTMYADNCPTILHLASTGTRAASLIPQFPSKTFPNHYTVVTGLYPENHGIVNNAFYDPLYNAYFSLSDANDQVEDRWWFGQPIWNTAELQGQKAAALYWPGSEANISGIHPSYYYKYNGSSPYNDRIQQLLSWLQLPNDKRPTFLCSYMEIVDSQGHNYGPVSPYVGNAISVVDNAIKELLNGLEVLHLRDQVNIVLTADHGMTATSQNRVILVDNYINLDLVNIVDWTPNLLIIPNPGVEQQVYANLSHAHPNMTVYWKEEIPSVWQYNNSRRITPIIGVADLGWSISSSSYYNSNKAAFNGGAHGYNNASPDMHGIFVGNGPAFRSDGYVVPSFHNLNIYSTLCHILGLEPAPNNGTVIQELLKQ